MREKSSYTSYTYPSAQLKKYSSKRGEYSKRRTCEAPFKSEELEKEKELEEKERSSDRAEERGERASTQRSSVLLLLLLHSYSPHRPPYPLSVQPATIF